MYMLYVMTASDRVGGKSGCLSYSECTYLLLPETIHLKEVEDMLQKPRLLVSAANFIREFSNVRLWPTYMYMYTVSKL